MNVRRSLPGRIRPLAATAFESVDLRRRLSGWAVACLLAAGACDEGGNPTAPAPRETCGGYTPWQTSTFSLPYPVGTGYLMSQGNCSGFGHSGVYKFSYDFLMPIGTEVAAAAAGIVVETRSRFVDGDLVSGHENFVKLQHADGSITAYSHLSTVLVDVGEAVVAGTIVGLSGNTGNTGNEPHLHFHRNRCSEPVDCGTEPVTFYNTDPNPEGLQTGRVYVAGPLRG